MSFQHHVKRYFSFTAKEKRDLVLTSLIIAFIMFFFVWRKTDFVLLSGASTILLLFIIACASMFLFISIPKLIAIKNGYTAHYTSWINGLLTGFVVSFISYGYIPLMFPGLITIKTIDRLRHGELFPGENKKGIMVVLLSAVVVAMFISALAYPFYIITNSQVFYYIMIMNAFIVFFSLLPVNNNIGLHLFYVKKGLYFPLLFFGLFFAIFTVLELYFSIGLAIIAAIFVWFATRKVFKKTFFG